MPINVTCPNPACGKPLSVQDQYAGMQGQCPYCKTIFTFPNPAPLPPVMQPVAPQSEATVAQPPVPWDSPPPAPGPRRLPGRLDLVSLILFGVGLFFLLLFFISVLVPWIFATFENRSLSSNGLGVAIGVILFVLSLLLMAAGTTVLILNFTLTVPRVVDRLLSYTFSAAAWFGTFAFFCLLAGLFRPWGLGAALSSDELKAFDDAKNTAHDLVRDAISKGAGPWMAFISALVIMGIFGFLAFLRPPELSLWPNANAFVRKWLILVSLAGSAVFLGLLVLLIHVI